MQVMVIQSLILEYCIYNMHDMYDPLSSQNTSIWVSTNREMIYEILFK